MQQNKKETNIEPFKERVNNYFELNKVCYYLVTLTLNILSIKYKRNIFQRKNMCLQNKNYMTFR